MKEALPALAIDGKNTAHIKIYSLHNLSWFRFTTTSLEINMELPTAFRKYFVRITVDKYFAAIFNNTYFHFYWWCCRFDGEMMLDALQNNVTLYYRGSPYYDSLSTLAGLIDADELPRAAYAHFSACWLLPPYPLPNIPASRAMPSLSPLPSSRFSVNTAIRVSLLSRPQKSFHFKPQYWCR